MDNLKVYSAPAGAVGNDDYRVYIRASDDDSEWEELFVYEVKVDMHHVRKASMVYFDMVGSVEVRITSMKQTIQRAVIRPLARNISVQHTSQEVSFTLDCPRKLSIEINGDRFSNLHLFANAPEENVPDPKGDDVFFIEPGIHRTEDIYSSLATPELESGVKRNTLYFAPGMHYLEETLLRIPSETTVYIAGGAVLIGSLVCEHVNNVKICGRGIIYLSEFHRFSAFRGVRIVFSHHIEVEGIITVDPPHYSIYIGQSHHIKILNFKSFSTRGWSDGIDMMSSSHIDIEDVFLRTSDDCIAVYGSRWDFYGDSSYISVRNAVLWADVAHPIMIGTHGNHHDHGDHIHHLQFENIDILEHHEPQPNYMGAMAINAGDNNIVSDVLFKQISVEDFELGRLFDLRVVLNKDYNPIPGYQIHNIEFEDISYWGDSPHCSQIFGYDEERTISNVTFTRFHINGQLLTQPDLAFININEFANGITFKE